MIKLTASNIREMSEPDKISYLWDAGVRGLGVRRTPAGVKSFIFRFRSRDAKKRQRILTLGRCEEMRLEDARDKARLMLSDVIQGKDPSAVSQASEGGATVRDMAERYAKEHAPRKKKASQTNDELLWRKHIIPLKGNVRVADFTTSDAIDIQNELLKKTTTANRAIALLSKAFALAEIWGWRAQNTNPCHQVQKFGENRRQRILSRAELRKFGQWLDYTEKNRTAGWRYVDLLRLLILTGCRRDEWRTGRWEWVNLEDKTYNLPTSKTGQKVVYLSEMALGVLDHVAAKRGGAGFPKSGYIFPSSKSARRAITWSHSSWTTMLRDMGLGNLRVHDLRHTVGSYAHASGLTQKQVADLLGHKRMETAARYIHDENRSAGANIAGNAIAGLLAHPAL